MRIKIRTLREELQRGVSYENREVLLKGWVKTFRDQKKFAFLELYDGSCSGSFQVVLGETCLQDQALISHLTTGASVAVEGKIVPSPAKGQSWEMQATAIELIGSCSSETYPLQKKKHSFEFLRSIAHLRPRTNTMGAVMRVRNALAFATHLFFQERGFLYVQTPILTSSDCEGAGQLFQVTTLNMDTLPRSSDGKIKYDEDFFGCPAYLTVSGQLNGESFACALSDIYTFGPTFRAENSHTSRHLAEFWMIEPEMAFANLQDDIACAEAYLKYIFKYVLDHCSEDLAFFDRFIAPGQSTLLAGIVESPFARISYTEAVEILLKSGRSFIYPVKWGLDLQSEHERYLAEEHFKKPVVVTDYPKEIKAFYMRLNSDNRTVAAMDILCPKVGEIIGGSQREERRDALQERITASGLDLEHYRWYLELREYGTVPHAGFGAGFERLVQFVTGMENIRDVIPFPRYPGKIEF